MKARLAITALVLLAGITASCKLAKPGSEKTMSATKHTRTEFHFVVDAPFEQAAPLFGANEERKWSEGWDPQFLYPAPARDQPGMVFRVEHPDRSSIWINTAFDLAAGHIQYAYVLSDAMSTLIDIRLTRVGAEKTRVTVVYERTALTPDADEHVEHFTKSDENAGQKWSDAINGYFAKQREAATK
jgi:hypothetical protein